MVHIKRDISAVLHNAANQDSAGGHSHQYDWQLFPAGQVTWPRLTERRCMVCVSGTLGVVWEWQLRIWGCVQKNLQPNLYVFQDMFAMQDGYICFSGLLRTHIKSWLFIFAFNWPKFVCMYSSVQNWDVRILNVELVMPFKFQLNSLNLIWIDVANRMQNLNLNVRKWN